MFLQTRCTFSVRTTLKQLKNGWENDDSDFIQALYSVYNVYILFSLIYSLTCLKKDTSVQLKLQAFEQVNKLTIKTMVLTFLKVLCICAQSL